MFDILGDVIIAIGATRWEMQSRCLVLGEKWWSRKICYIQSALNFVEAFGFDKGKS